MSSDEPDVAKDAGAAPAPQAASPQAEPSDAAAPQAASPPGEGDDGERGLAGLVRRLRGNPGRLVLVVDRLDPAHEVPPILEAHLREAIDARVGLDVRERLEADAAPVERARAFLGLLAPDLDERRELVAEVLSGRTVGPGDEALAALCLGDVVRAVVLPSGDGALAALLRARARPPREVDLADETVAGAAATTARWTELARLDAPWLVKEGEADDELPGRIAAWLERTAGGGGVVVVGHDGRPDPLLEAIGALAGSSRGLPLGVTWLGDGQGEGRDALATALPAGLVHVPAPDPGRALEAIRARLGVAPLSTARQPLVRRILDTAIEPPLVVARVPVLSGYQDLVEGVPSFTVRAVLLTLLAIVGVIALANGWVAIGVLRHLGRLRDRLEALSAAEVGATGSPGDDARAEARDRARDAEVLELLGLLRDPALVPSWFFMPAFVGEALVGRAAALEADVLAWDDGALDFDLYRHGLRARVRFDRRYGSFGRFPEPELARGGPDGPRVPLGAALEHRRAVVTAPRDLLVEVVLLRAADMLAADARLPVVVSLRGYEGGELIDLVVQELERTGRLAPDDLNRDAVLERLQQGDVVVLFTGLEGARKVERAVHRVGRFAEDFPASAVWLGLQDDRFAADLPGFAAFSVAPFTRPAVLAWFERTGLPELAAALRDRPRLLELACDPLLSSLIARHFEATGAVPASRVRLFERFVDDYLLELESSRASVAPTGAPAGASPAAAPDARTAEDEGRLSVLATKTLLAQVAGPLVFQERRELRRDVAVEMLARYLKMVPEATLNPELILGFAGPTPGDAGRAERLLDRLIETGILVPVRGDAVRFSDPDFEATFRARALMTRIRRGTWRIEGSPVDAGAIFGLFSEGMRHYDAFRRFQEWRKVADEVPPDPELLLVAATMLGVGDPLDPLLDSRVVDGLVGPLTGPYDALAARAIPALARLDRPATALRLVRELSRPLSPAAHEQVLRAIEAVAHPVAIHPLLTRAAAAPAGPARDRLLLAAARTFPDAAVVDAVLAATAPATSASAVAPGHDLLALALEQLVAQDAPVPDAALDARLRAEPLRWAALVPHLPRRGPAGLELALAWLEAADLLLATSPDLVPATAETESRLARAATALASFGPGARERLLARLRQPAGCSLAIIALAAFGEPGDREALALAVTTSAHGLDRSTTRVLAGLASTEDGVASVASLAAALHLAPGAIGVGHGGQSIDAGLELGPLGPALARSDAGEALLEGWLEAATTAAGKVTLAEALVEPAVASPAARAASLSVLDDPDAALRGRALRALGRCSDADVQEALLARVDGPDRWLVLEALASAWDRSELGPFEAAATASPAAPELVDVALALGRTGRPDVLPLLVRLLGSERPDAWRFADALAATRDPAAVEALVQALPRDEVAMAPVEPALAILRALTATCGVGNRPSISFPSWLKHPDRRVASAAYDLYLATDTPYERR